MATISTTIKLVDQMSSKLSEIESAVGTLKSKLGELDSQVGSSQSALNGFDWKTFGDNAKTLGGQMEQLGKQMLISLSTPLVYVGKKMYGFATDYESAFAGVKKTTEATDEEYNQLYSDLIQISETTPTGFVEAAGIMEMAGQLGVGKVNEFGEDISEQYAVATEDLTAFTRTFIGLQESTNIAGEEGAANLARFLNVTEKTTKNVERVSGVIVGLGNNFATTENEILAMATRMGATADLAGFSSAEILAFSAALSSVGINAEAGGSAAGKLMKKMQLAAEVGGSVEEKLRNTQIKLGSDKEGNPIYFDMDEQGIKSGLDFVNYIAGMGKADKVNFADQLGMTADALGDFANNWLLMDQFSEVMGITGEDFLSGWKKSPAESMLKFFQGLGNLDPEKGNSVLAQLAEMDLTEIRLSNLVAALAGNSDLFANALAQAYQLYGEDTENNALQKEVGKRYETQESKNEMLANKGQNAMANLGENIVKAVQPALDKVNELLDAFNGLSEVDQDNIVKLMGALILAPVAITGLGKVATSVGDIATAVGKFKEWGGVKKVFDVLGTFLTTPVGNALLLAGAVAGIAAALESIPTETEQIISSLQDIKITIDDESVEEALKQIKRVQDAADKLAGGAEVNEQYESNSTSVSMGYGTTSMYGTALGYESVRTNAQVADTINGYATQIAEAENNINQATVAMGKATTQAEREAAQEQQAYWKNQADTLREQMNIDVSGLQSAYASKLSDLFGGMASQYPEEAKQLENAVAQYDVFAATTQAKGISIDQFESPEAFTEAYNTAVKKVMSLAWDAGLVGTDQFESIDKIYELIDNGQFQSADWVETLTNSSLASMEEAAHILENNPAITSWLSTIFSDEALLENFNPSEAQGALAGMLRLLDLKSAVEQAGGDVTKIGSLLSKIFFKGGSEAGVQMDNGAASGIGSGSSTVINASSSVAQAAVAKFKAMLGIRSPSRVFAQLGVYIDEGLANGITGDIRTVQNAVGRVADIVYGAVDNEAWSDIGVFSDLENSKFLDPENKEIKVTDSDMKNIRKLAEREIINQFTTAEIKVEMNNTNNINSEMDLDGVVSYLENKVSERLEMCAEGVYE